MLGANRRPGRARRGSGKSRFCAMRLDLALQVQRQLFAQEQLAAKPTRATRQSPTKWKTSTTRLKTVRTITGWADDSLNLNRDCTVTGRSSFSEPDGIFADDNRPRHAHLLHVAVGRGRSRPRRKRAAGNARRSRRAPVSRSCESPAVPTGRSAAPAHARAQRHTAATFLGCDTPGGQGIEPVLPRVASPIRA